jgi:adenosylcobinamide amidohydrolase
MPDYCERVLGLQGEDSKKTVALLTSVPQMYLGQSACGKCLVTAGLGNASPLIPETVWDEKKDEMIVYSPGTINCILVLSDSLTQGALVEAYGMAKIAISEVVRFWSLCRGASVCVGTPTDCTALLCPQNGPKIKFAGLGTKVGADVATLVVDAMTNAIRHRYPDFKHLVCDI